MRHPISESILELRAEGKLAEALEKLNKLIAAHPGDSLGYLYRAELETDCGMLPQALGDSDVALKERHADPAGLRLPSQDLFGQRRMP